jgi:hypothetical protein
MLSWTWGQCYVSKNIFGEKIAKKFTVLTKNYANHVDNYVDRSSSINCTEQTLPSQKNRTDLISSFTRFVLKLFVISDTEENG